MQTIVKHLYCDIAIIGGGAGGCSAAITSAKRGLHTIIFEKGVSLGGLSTNGYVPQVAGMIEGNCKEFVKRLEVDGRLARRSAEDDHNPTFDPEWAKFVFETMIGENGGRIIYDSTCIDVEMDGRNIKSAIFFTKGGWVAVHAPYYVDATGDADVAAMAGVPYQVGGADYAGLNMSTTLGTRWLGYNKLVYEAADKAWRKEQLEKGLAEDKHKPLIYALEEKAIANGELVRHVASPFAGLFQVSIPDSTKENMDFCTFSFHSYFTRNTDVEDISRQILEQHQLIQQFERFLRKYVPGYENIHLIGMGSLPGVRDSRRIFGEYMLKESDVAAGTKFEDGIARFPEMFDTHHPTNAEVIFQRHIHMPAAQGSAVCRDPQCSAAMHPFGRPAGLEARSNPRDYCDIPYRSLLPKGVDNLLAVGRCCSAEFHANGAMRIIGPAMGTGQAAGVAVDLANKAGAKPRDISGKEVRRVLIEEEGVNLNKFPEGWWSKLRDLKGDYQVAGGDMVRIV
jgi:hypothetical protein